jgi:hypothetical protein
LSAAVTADPAPAKTALPGFAEDAGATFRAMANGFGVVRLLDHHPGQCRWIVSDVWPVVYRGAPAGDGSSWCGKAFRTRLHSRPQALDLFSGIGGFRLGLERAGDEDGAFGHKANAETAAHIVRKRKAALRGEPARCFMVSVSFGCATEPPRRTAGAIRDCRRSEAAAFSASGKATRQDCRPSSICEKCLTRTARRDLGSPRPGSFPCAPPLRTSAQRITLPSSRQNHPSRAVNLSPQPYLVGDSPCQGRARWLTMISQAPGGPRNVG